MTAIAPTTQPLRPLPADPTALRGAFTSLAVDMSRIDAKLEAAQRNQERPTSGWDTTFDEFAQRLDQARMGFAQVRPDDQQMIGRLGQDLLTVAKHAGTLGQMQQHRLSFASGWDTLLDRTIADVQQAAMMLDGAPPVHPPTRPPVPPTTPPAPPVTPTPGIPSNVRNDVSRAVQMIEDSIRVIRTVPESDRGDATTKDARIAAFNRNMEAQKVLEQHFSSADQVIVSTLRRADASLEDANWQLAKKPSPDGRFNGVDIPGALRDSQAAVDLLNGMLATASSVAA